MPRPKKYPDELRERAVGRVARKQRRIGVALLEVGQDLLGRLVGGLVLRVEDDLGVERRLVRIGNTGELLDFAGERLLIKALDVAALGLPPYAKGRLEGFLFPATYDVEPGTTAASLLKTMVARYGQAAAGGHAATVRT